MKGAIMFTWGSPKLGREAKSLEVFGKALGYYEGLAKQGRIEGQRVYFSNTGLARMAGILLVEGELEELHKIMQEDEFRRIQLEAASIVQDLDIQIVSGGSPDDVQQQVQMFSEVLSSLGYM